MSLDLFRTTLGIDIQTDDLTSNAYILQGIGAPGADGAEQDDAPVGSIYMRTDDFDSEKLQLYWKHTAGSGADKWSLAASKEFVENAVQGISWREPASLLDATSYADSSAFPTSGTIDGVPLVVNDRVLFSNVGVAGDNNVFIWDGAAWTEDDNAETDGDAILINKGTHADEQWIYDGSNWIQFGGAGSATELGFIRAFIGKDTSGNITPDYPSNAIVIDGNSLENEIGRLDHATGDLTFATPNLLSDYSDNLGSGATGTITDNLQAIDDAFGDGVIAPAGSNYVLDGNLSFNGGTETITSALDSLNEGIGPREYADENYVVDGEVLSTSIDKLDSALGAPVDQVGSWTAGGFLDTTELTTAPTGGTIQNILNQFNQEIGDLADDTDEKTGGPVTGPTPTPIDAVPASEVTEIKWMLQVKDGSGNRRAFEIHALSNGTTVDFNRFSVLRLGNTGSIGVDVTINGSSEIELSIAPANALTYTVKRISKSFLA